jgi:tRNA uridine 5-carboxymethylaminomethyl modification enzyme
MQEEIRAVPNLTLVEGSVSDLLITPVEPGSGSPLTVGKMQGIALGNGEVIHASQVIITTGTFLGGEIHIGIVKHYWALLI